MRMHRGLALAVVVAALLTGCAAAPTPVVSANPHAGHSQSPAPPPGPLREGEHFTAVQLPEPYTPKPPTGGTDEYRCFLVDPQLGGATWVTGSQFLPQQADIVH